jgi:serine/threonine-protein kinase
MTPADHPSTLPPGLAGRLNPVCDRFESQWLAGAAPRLEEFLPLVAEADRPALLRELLDLELHYRGRKGEHATPEEYCRRLPQYADVIVTAFSSTSVFENRPVVPPDAAPTKSLPTIPGYEIIEELGRGGMGVVYKARQLSVNRLVALKMILGRQHVSLRARVRFQIEGEAVARLAHPHIVQLYESGECDGTPYFSLEYCSGGSLGRQLEKDKPWPGREAALLLEKLARATHAAHQQGIIHRDLKPANILFSGQWRVASKHKRIFTHYSSRRLPISALPGWMTPSTSPCRARSWGRRHTWLRSRPRVICGKSARQPMCMPWESSFTSCSPAACHLTDRRTRFRRS